MGDNGFVVSNQPAGLDAAKGFPLDEIQEPARALKKHGPTLRGLDTRQHFVCWMPTKERPWIRNLSKCRYNHG